MTTDRLNFKKEQLQNGVTIWSHSMDVPFVQVRIVIPVGTAHSNNGNYITNGIVHFLEHICTERSKLFPERNSFEKTLADSGGSFNAWTGVFQTTFFMQVPTEDFDKLFQGLMSQIFEPVFDADDIALQKDVIRNERQQQKYFPSDNELSHYKFTEWMQACFCSKDQVFGTDLDLESITVEELKKVHHFYFSNEIQVFVGGTYNKKFLKEALSNLKTIKHNLIEEYKPYSWKNKDFHLIESKDTETPIYSIGNLTSDFIFDDTLGVALLCDMLTNSQYGILNNWIRKEKGWSYGLISSVWFSKRQLGWIIDIPLNETDVVTTICGEFFERTEKLLNDSDAITVMKNRITKAMCFELQTLSERIDSASEPVLSFGINLNESDFNKWLDEHCTTDFLKYIYDTYFAKDKVGELLAVPIVL